MNYTDIIVEKKGPVVWITLNKPQRKNALGRQTFLELSAVIDDIEKDATVVAVVIKGAGDSFCSGIDLKDAASSPDPAERLAFKRLADKLWQEVWSWPCSAI
jgi:enoyl-CoA hydratase/carnithine racemase